MSNMEHNTDPRYGYAMGHATGQDMESTSQNQFFQNPYQQTYLSNASYQQNKGQVSQSYRPNVRFYKNQIPASPDVELIEGILNWKRDYQVLEKNQTYLQWLFPNRISGFNQMAYELNDEEAQIIRETPQLKQRVKRAFEMMLDFYGMRLTEDNNFELTENSEERLQFLNQWQNNNFKRVSRILLALKELGHEKLMLPWLTFIADLMYKDGKLENAKKSFHQHWIKTLDAEDHISLKKHIAKYENTITSSAEKGIRNKMPQVKFPNVAFYMNEIPSEPSGDYIENILTQWKGNYKLLEENHNYIQWLFPNKVLGVNRYCSPLVEEETKIIRETPELKQRVKRAFEMMLDFYGMRLTEGNNFELTENSSERLQELNRSSNHNFLRISRILLALKELGHSNLMVPWLKFLADLIFMENILDHAEKSFKTFWIESLDAEDKIEMVKYMNAKQ